MTGVAKSVDGESAPLEKSDGVPHFDDEGNEFLQVIDGEPANPPPYNAVNPNRRVSFPVYEYEETSSVPPAYKPTVSECTAVSVKWEWLTPYEVSPLKSWRNYLMEINSTQLNFYDIDTELTQDIKNYSSGANEVQHSHHLFSMSKGRAYQFNRVDQERIAARLQRDMPKYLCSSKMVKSFSLQCAKVGIPTDYTKKTFVLRLRCEQEQFMINFAHVDDMIMWSVYLQTGIGVSLDLDLREYPNYRVIPRRRRPFSRTGNRSRGSSISRPGSGGGSGSIGRISGINGHGNGFGNSNSNNNNNNNNHNNNNHNNDNNNNDNSSRFRRPMGPQRSISAGKLSLSALSSVTRHSNSGSSTHTSGSRGSPHRSDSPEVLPSLHRHHFSTGAVPQFPFKTITGHKLNSADESPHLVKSKLKHLFKNDDPPKLVSSKSSGTIPTIPKDSRVKVSPPQRPSLNSDDIKPKFRVGDLKSVREDTETEDTPPTRPMLSPHSNMQRPAARRMASSPLLSLGRQSSDSRSPTLSTVATPTPTPPNESVSPLPRTATQKEAEEVQQVRCEHNDPEIADLHDRIRASFSNEVADEFGPRGGRSHPSGERSIYMEEGMFRENEGDYIYVRRPHYNPRGKSDALIIKWNPLIKEQSRGRYVLDSLRCVKPLNDSDKWMGGVVFKPHRPPHFPTNNPPIPYGFMPKIPNLHAKEDPWKAVDYKRTKNHYLRPYIVGTGGLVKAAAKPHNIYEEV